MKQFTDKHGYTYAEDNAHFLDNGDIVPKVCPYCKMTVDDPITYLDDHEECLFDC